MTNRPEPAEWTALPYDDWLPTKNSLQLYSQVLGTARLSLTPPRPQCLAAPLHLTSRGLTTGPLSWGTASVELSFDLIDHELLVTASDGWSRTISLTPGRCVAEFYESVMRALVDLGVDISPHTTPGAPGGIPFGENHDECVYDPAAARRFFRVLTATHNVLDEWRSRFAGWATLQFWWDSFDLSIARFPGSGRPVPRDAGCLMRHGLGIEHFSVGWWPGDERFPEPAFFAYACPKPPGAESVTLESAGAFWEPRLGEWILRYEEARAGSDTRGIILDFFEGTWRAAGKAAGWDPDAQRFEPTTPQG